MLPTYDILTNIATLNLVYKLIHTLDNIHIGVTICEDLWNDEEFGKHGYVVNPIADIKLGLI